MRLFQQISLYWKCQLIGWSAAALYWGFTGYLGDGFSWTLALIHFIGDLIIYIGLSHTYRNISVKLGWHELSIRKLVLRLMPTIVLLGLIFMLLTISKNYLVRFWIIPDYLTEFSTLFSDVWLTVFVTGIRMMSIWLLAYYGYHFAVREINAVKESSQLSIIAKDAAFNNLSSQLNPHFFFNALNSIKALVHENPQATRRAIDLLSDLLRTSLYRKDAVLISLEEEIAMVNDYLELEKIRLENRLLMDVFVDKGLMSQNILPFSIQLLAENAVKHGITSFKEGGLLSIVVTDQGEMIVIEVRNPGILQDIHAKGLGIKNLKERLQLYYDGKAFFEIKQCPDNTVLVTLIIPKK